MLKLTDDYNSFANCANNGSEYFNNIFLTTALYIPYLSYF